MAEESKKISFGFAKSIKKPLLKNVQPQTEKKVDYIESIDEKAIKIIGKEEPKDEPLIIPLIGSRTWHDRIVNRIDADIFETKTTTNVDENSMQVVIKTEPRDTISNGNTTSEINNSEPVQVKSEPCETNDTPAPSLDELAAKEILKDLNSTDKEVKETKVLTLPLTEDSSLRGQAESTLQDYEQIPVNEFGFAMLRGMGWQPGRGIGKNEKVVEPVMPELRPKGMGLGADKVAKQKQNVDRKGKQEEDLKVEKGSFVKIIVGKCSNSYGQIEGLDDDAGRVIVKMALGGNLVSLNEFMVQPVTKAEFSKNAKVLNAKKYEEYKNKEKTKDHVSINSSSEDSSEEVKEQRKEKAVKSETKKHRAKEESKSRKRHSSDSESDGERNRRKRRNSSSSDEAPKSKASKSSKKHKHRDDSSKHSSKKSSKSNKEREYKEDKKHRDSDKRKSSDKRKHKKHKRSRSRSPKKR